MPKRSAGLLLYRRSGDAVEVFLVHPGGPFWSKKDLGAWSIPKGEYSEAEEPFSAARREFKEETGFTAPDMCFDLGEIKQSGGKVVHAWACEGDCEPSRLASNHCEIEWPPRSGRKIEIPEIDRGEWFGLVEARARILNSQGIFLERLAEELNERHAASSR